jgi:hypothetical protein
MQLEKPRYQMDSTIINGLCFRQLFKVQRTNGNFLFVPRTWTKHTFLLKKAFFHYFLIFLGMGTL